MKTADAAHPLPPAFVLPAPDDALVGPPQAIARGTSLIFQRGAQGVRPGQIVLVEDRSGRRHVRRYAEAADGGWIAQAPNPTYPSFESERHGLVVVAVVQWVGAEAVGAG